MKHKYLRKVALFMALNVIWEISFPAVCYALTGGPSQPEMESFEPVGTTDMVDLFTGDFNYNIPLLDVGGYPINIAYHSGIGMDQEASWVGLGWNINPGVINRSVRGLPDDFKGDEITNETKIRDNETWGINAGVSVEVLGLTKKGREKVKAKGDTASTKININFGFTQNNYRGLGLTFGTSFSIPAIKTNIGFNASSQGGFSYDGGFSMLSKNEKNQYGISQGIGSRGGLKDLTFSYSRVRKKYDPVTKSQEKGVEGGRSSSISFSSPAALPSLSNSFRTTVQNYNFTLGMSAWGLHPNFRLGGTFSKTILQDRIKTRKAYGYMYAEEIRHNQGDGLQDFSRERDAPMDFESKALPLTAINYDFFNVSGQGTGGMFRIYRKNLGVYYDPNIESTTSNWGNVGAEVGLIPNSYHFGVDFTPTGGKEKSGRWSNGFEMDRFNFTYGDVKYDTLYNEDDSLYVVPTGYNHPLSEPFYFKATGEKTSVDMQYYNNIVGDELVKLSLHKPTPLNLLRYYSEVVPTLEKEKDGSKKSFTSTYSYYGREPRAQVLTNLTCKEAKMGMGQMPTLKSYKPNKFVCDGGAYETITRPSNKDHHIGELVQNTADGSKYIYAIPAYNNLQQEVVFNINGNTIDVEKGLAHYDGEDNTHNNSKGASRFFNKETTPAYAHSYLLTAVLKPNYVDADDIPGPSKGDIGDYVLFHYTRHHEAYKWRVPLEKNMGQFQQGLLSDKDDDKANYIYGTKEIWYLHSVETKTHIAEFKTSPRKDAHGVEGENGGMHKDQTQLKLDTIVMYSLYDKMINGANATPVKKVVFEYDYSLCPNVPNNINYGTGADNGKLTLKKMYFIYGYSGRGRMSPYQFKYNESNRSYNMAHYDRWGNFKPHDGHVNNKDFPYVNQNTNKDSLDSYASAWSLEQITLPSGGTIKVKYEIDDYAYVQDKKAMQMVEVVGVSDHESLNGFKEGLEKYSKLYDKNDKRSEYLIIKRPKGVNTNDELKNKCFAGIEKLYFKFLIDIKGGALEYINGWCDIDKSEMGLLKGEYAFIKMNPAKQGDRMFNTHTPVNPIAKSAWQFAMAHLSKVLHPGTDVNGTGAKAFKELMKSFGEATDMFRGQYQVLKKQNIAHTFVPNKSWIRIECATMKKYGGGVRVKELAFSDSWANMDEADRSATYAQQYQYTTKDGNNNEISSGVAAYEPMIGGEENPIRQLAESYKKETNLTMPALELFVEEPFGESFYPAPTVGYSKVTVRNKPKEGVARTGTGYSVHEFYTAKDYPVKVERSALQQQSKGMNPTVSAIASLLKVMKKSYHASSQGYCIKVNDMHGKPRRTSIYGEAGLIDEKAPLISEVSYEYDKDNVVNVLNPDGTISEALVGKEVDFSMDVRENEQVNWNGGLEVNLKVDFSPTPPVIVAWGIPIPKFSYEMTRAQTASVTKVVQCYGILTKTTVRDEGSIISTQNVLFDKLTGSALLTKTSNSFNDPIYNFNYPAHLAYEGMGPSYTNIGAAGTLTIASQIVTTTFPLSTFYPGDEVFLTKNNEGLKAWVLHTNKTGSSQTVSLIDKNGNEVSDGTYEYKIVSSGRKNMLGEQVGNISMAQSPIQNNELIIPTQHIIHASANTFKDEWPMNKLYSTTSGYPFSICEWTPDTNIIELFRYFEHALKQAQNNSLSSPDTLNQLPWFDTSALKSYLQGVFHHFPTDYYGALLVDKVSTDSGNLVRVVLNPNDWIDSSRIILYISPLINYLPNNCHFAYEIWNSDGIPFSQIKSIIKMTGNSSSSGFLEVELKNGELAIFSFKLECDYYHLSNFFTSICHYIGPECSYFTTPIYNPFRIGNKGLWLSHQQKAFVEERVSYLPGETTFIRKDGMYKTFQPYWNFTLNDYLLQNTHKRWINAATITRINKKAAPVESRDALNNYSAELYGYNNNLVTVSSSYARTKDLANDNFEEYTLLNSSPCGSDAHWNFQYGHDMMTELESETSLDIDTTEYHAPEITTAFAHTGTQSLLIPKGYIRSVRNLLDTGYVLKNSMVYNRFVDNCELPFMPERNKKYVVSAWVRGRTGHINSTNSYDSIFLHVKTIQGSIINRAYIFKPTGPIIDGWQRIEGVFSLPKNAMYLDFSIENASRYNAYIDDIRIHPFESNMKTYVYHPTLLRVMAILDENNFATFYEYDYEGKLIRIKKETAKGIVTIQESRNGIRKPLNP